MQIIDRENDSKNDTHGQSSQMKAIRMRSECGFTEFLHDEVGNGERAFQEKESWAGTMRRNY